MLKALFSIFLVFWVVEITAQGTYFKNRMEYIPNDIALNYGIIPISTGGYLTFGSHEMQANFDRYGAVIKIDELGNGVDTLRFRYDTIQTEIVSMFEINNSYYAITRYWTNVPPLFYTSLVKINQNLDTVWSKKMDYGFDTSVFVSYAMLTRDSAIAISGIFTDTNGYQSILLLKIDTLGNEIFFKSYGYTNEHQFNYWNMDQTLDGGFILAGASTFFHPMGAGYEKHIAIKTDSLGNQEWIHPFGRNDNDNGGCKVKALRDSTILIYANTPTNASPTPVYDWSFRKVSYANQLIWNNQYGPYHEYNVTNDIVELEDSSLVAHRLIYLRSHITKLDKNANIIWDRFNKPTVSSFMGLPMVFVPSDSGFVYSGFIQPQLSLGDTGTQDIFIIKTNCIGWADPPFADATTGSLDNFEVVLDNNSIYFGNCFIDWGDGNLDTLYESSDTLIYHTYSSDGIFNATIIAEACGDKDTLNLNVVSSLVGVAEHEKRIFRIFPNPTNEILHIQLDELNIDFDVILSDITGKIILQDRNALTIDVSDFSTGIYFITIPQLNSTEKIQVLR